MIARLVRLAANRDGHIAIKAAKLLLEYGYGKPPEQINLLTNDMLIWRLGIRIDVMRKFRRY